MLRLNPSVVLFLFIFVFAACKAGSDSLNPGGDGQTSISISNDDFDLSNAADADKLVGSTTRNGNGLETPPRLFSLPENYRSYFFRAPSFANFQNQEDLVSFVSDLKDLTPCKRKTAISRFFGGNVEYCGDGSAAPSFNNPRDSDLPTSDEVRLYQMFMGDPDLNVSEFRAQNMPSGYTGYATARTLISVYKYLIVGRFVMSLAKSIPTLGNVVTAVPSLSPSDFSKIYAAIPGGQKRIRLVLRNKSAALSRLLNESIHRERALMEFPDSLIVEVAPKSNIYKSSVLECSADQPDPSVLHSVTYDPTDPTRPMLSHAEHRRYFPYDTSDRPGCVNVGTLASQYFSLNTNGIFQRTPGGYAYDLRQPRSLSFHGLTPVLRANVANTCYRTDFSGSIDFNVDSQPDIFKMSKVTSNVPMGSGNILKTPFKSERIIAEMKNVGSSIFDMGVRMADLRYSSALQSLTASVAETPVLEAHNMEVHQATYRIDHPLISSAAAVQTQIGQQMTYLDGAYWARRHPQAQAYSPPSATTGGLFGNCNSGFTQTITIDLLHPEIFRILRSMINFSQPNVAEISEIESAKYCALSWANQSMNLQLPPPDIDLGEGDSGLQAVGICNLAAAHTSPIGLTE